MAVDDDQLSCRPSSSCIPIAPRRLSNRWLRTGAGFWSATTTRSTATGSIAGRSCLAHLIRKAGGLAERADDSCRRFGVQLKSSCSSCAGLPMRRREKLKWSRFYTRLMLLLWFFEGAEDDAGRLAREVLREIDSLWVFLDEAGVEPTNNRAERALRFAVLWRKRSNGTQSEKGNRWVERLLSFRQTCRLRKQATFPLLVDP